MSKKKKTSQSNDNLKVNASFDQLINISVGNGQDGKKQEKQNVAPKKKAKK